MPYDRELNGELLKLLHAYILHNYGYAAREGGKAAEAFELGLARQIDALTKGEET